MAQSGAPTGKWETIPPHLRDDASEVDLVNAGARLTVRRIGVPEVVLDIEKSSFVIGRQASDVDLVLDDELVSRRHAELTMDPRGYFRLQDLGSQNGIRFGGRRVERLNLIDGDSFFIGRTEFVFHAKMTRLDAEQTSKRPERANSDIDVPKAGRAENEQRDDEIEDT